MRLEHTFSMDIFDAAGHYLGRSPINPDWAPLAEHVHFSGIRGAIFPPAMSQPQAALCPVWHDKRGAPFVGGVRIEMSLPDGTRHDASFPLDCFTAEAKRLSGEYVSAGVLKAGDVFQYRVVAMRLQQRPAAKSPLALLDVEEVEQPLVMQPASRQRLLDRSLRLGSRSTGNSDLFPVFIAQEPVAQCVDLVRAAGDLETGGILIGRLHRDSDDGQIFMHITAQIPAEHIEQQHAQLTFTDRTWAAARQSLAQRNSDEIILGWHHSHPDFCRKCDQNKRETCALNGIFFSATDCALHRAMFPRAWQVGLLLSNRPTGIIPALFGWNQGQIKSSGFYLLAPENQTHDPNLLETLGSVETEVLATVGGDENHGS